MTQLLPRRRRRTSPAQIHPRKPAHQITHATTSSSGTAKAPTHPSTNRPSASNSSSRRWRVKQPHDICHPTTRRRSPRRHRSGHPIGGARARRVLLCTCRSRAIKIDIQQVLDIALLRATARAVGGGSRGCYRCRDGVLGGVLPLLLNGGALDGFGAEAALADERLRWLVVDRGESGEFRQEMFQEDGRQAGDGGGDGGFLGEDNVLRREVNG